MTLNADVVVDGLRTANLLLLSIVPLSEKPSSFGRSKR